VSVLQAGDKLPSVELYENTPANKVNLSDLTKGKKVVIFAVPGAFTPGCSKVNGFSNSVAFPDFLLRKLFYSTIGCLLGCDVVQSGM
jgi:2-Cys peroxiredoxin 5